MEETDVQNMELLQKRISEIGIIPVIKIKDAAGAVRLRRRLRAAACRRRRSPSAPPARRRRFAASPHCRICSSARAPSSRSSRLRAREGRRRVLHRLARAESRSGFVLSRGGRPRPPRRLHAVGHRKALSLGLKTGQVFSPLRPVAAWRCSRR